MKKYLVFAMSIALAFGFASCGSDDPEPNPVDNGVTPLKLKKPEFVNQAACYTITDKDCSVKFIDFTESGRVIIQKTKEFEIVPETRADGYLEYLIGTFKWDGKQYTVYAPDFSVLCYLTTSKLSNGKYSISVQFPDQDPIVAEGTAVSKATETDLTSDLCRSWKVDKTRIRHEGSVTAAKEFQGCNLNEILEYAKTKATINESFAPNKVVTDVILTRTGSFYIFYANGDNDFGTWTWKNQTKGELTYKWRDAEMGNKFESGEATFDVRTGKYCLTLDADIEDGGDKYNVSLTFYLSEK